MQRARHAQRRRDICRRRDADHQPLLPCQAARHSEGFFGADLDHFVGQAGVVDAGHHAGGLHMLHAFERVVGAIGLHGAQPDIGAPFAQSSARAHKGAAGAERGDEVRDLARRLAPDFLACRLVVGAWVGGVVVLVRIEVAFGLALDQFADRMNREIDALARVGQDKLGAQGAQGVPPLNAGIGR
jgi:hypothetical protein